MDTCTAKNLLDAIQYNAFIVTNLEGQITHLNQPAEELLEYRAKELLGHANIMDIFDEEDVALHGAMLRKLLDHPVEDAAVFSTLAIRFPAKKHLFSLISKTQKRMGLEFIISVIRNDAEEDVGLLFQTDSLSAWTHKSDTMTTQQIIDRQSFERVLQREMHRMQRMELPLSLLKIEIEHPERIDHDREQFAKKYLEKVSNLLSKKIKRTSDIITYNGDDNFIVLLPDTNVLNTVKIADDLHDTLGNIIIDDEKIAASIGIVTEFPDNETENAALLQRLDQALRQAKAQGKNRTRLG